MGELWGTYLGSAITCWFLSYMLDILQQRTIGKMTRLLGFVFLLTAFSVPVAWFADKVNYVTDAVDKFTAVDPNSGFAKLWNFILSYPGTGDYTAPGGKVGQ